MDVAERLSIAARYSGLVVEPNGKLAAIKINDCVMFMSSTNTLKRLLGYSSNYSDFSFELFTMQKKGFESCMGGPIIPLIIQFDRGHTSLKIPSMCLLAVIGHSLVSSEITEKK